MGGRCLLRRRARVRQACVRVSLILVRRDAGYNRKKMLESAAQQHSTAAALLHQSASSSCHHPLQGSLVRALPFRAIPGHEGKQKKNRAHGQAMWQRGIDGKTCKVDLARVPGSAACRARPRQRAS